MVQQLNFSALLLNIFNLQRHSSEKHNSEVFQIYVNIFILLPRLEAG